MRGLLAVLVLAGGMGRAATPAADTTLARINALIDAGIALNEGGNTQEGRELCRQAWAIAKAGSRPKDEATALRILSGMHMLAGDFSQAQAYGIQALERAAYAKSRMELFYCSLNLGDVYFDDGQDRQAIRYYIKARGLIDKRHSRVAVGRLFNALGLLEDKLKNYPKAIANYQRAIGYYRLSPDPRSASTALSHIGIGYYNLGQKDSALRYYLLALHMKEAIGDAAGLPSVLCNVGTIYRERKANALALRYFTRAARLVAPLDQKRVKMSIYNNLAELMLEAGNLAGAGHLLDSSLRLGRILNQHEILAETYGLASRLTERQGRPRQALYYYKALAALRDTLYDRARTADVNETIIRYETALKDKEIRVLSAEKLRRQADAQRQAANRNLLLAGLLGAGLLSTAGITLYYARRSKQAQREFLRQVIQSQEDERSRISKDLHDGLGQSLVVLKNRMGDETTLIDQAIAELRAISRSQHPIQLEKLGLKMAIEGIVEAAAVASPIFFSHDIDEAAAHLSGERQTHLYRIMQECVSNILKHSEASDARIILEAAEQRVTVTVLDNGRGFAYPEARRRRSLGLTSIEERTKLIGGDLSITSAPGETRIRIRLRYG